MRAVILEPWRNPAAASGQWIPAASLGIAAIGLLSGPGAGSDKEFKPPEQAKKAPVSSIISTLRDASRSSSTHLSGSVFRKIATS